MLTPLLTDQLVFSLALTAPDGLNWCWSRGVALCTEHPLLRFACFAPICIVVTIGRCRVGPLSEVLAPGWVELSGGRGVCRSHEDGELYVINKVIHSVSTYKGQRGIQTSLSQKMSRISTSHVPKFCLINTMAI